MKLHRVLALASVLMFLAQTANAGISPPGQETRGGYTYTLDYYYNASDGYYYGDACGEKFEIWELGSRIRDGRLEFSIWTNLPHGGASGTDSYSVTQPVNISPGDLWITLGSSDPFASGPGITRYAVALTTHANVVPQKYNTGGVPDVWPLVTAGCLYKEAVYATGTLETYQSYMKDNDYWFWPDDEDGDDDQNSYMTLIRGFGDEVADPALSGVTWTREDYLDWDGTDWYLHEAWRVEGYVDVDEIGLQPYLPYNYSLFISVECGNDGTGHTPIAEPSVLALFAGGLAVAAFRRRRD